mgnify:FL=1
MCIKNYNSLKYDKMCIISVPTQYSKITFFLKINPEKITISTFFLTGYHFMVKGSMSYTTYCDWVIFMIMLFIYLLLLLFYIWRGY